MSQLNRDSYALTSAAFAATLALSSCRSIDTSESAQSIVVVSAFETLGDAQPHVAQNMAEDLAAALNVDPCLEARTQRAASAPGSAYVLNGSVYAEGQRAFVALQLVESKTAERVWFENYDYRGISAEEMAKDILRYLHDSSGRLISGCSRLRAKTRAPAEPRRAWFRTGWITGDPPQLASVFRDAVIRHEGFLLARPE